MTDGDPEDVQEAEAQRGLAHEDPDAEQERAGLGDHERRGAEPLPDEPRD